MWQVLRRRRPSRHTRLPALVVQGWHGQLGDALPAGDKAAWTAVKWVDPRLESHATQVGCG